ncbi:hypothetical protein pb186bvf_016791 [Paramecium bursaria]
MRQFPIKQFTVIQPVLDNFNAQDGQKSYQEFIYPTNNSFNLKSILLKQNLEHYYGIQIEMNYRILVRVLEKLLNDLEDGIYYSALREEDIWIRVNSKDEQINLQGIFNFYIEFSVLPLEDYENAITQDEFKKIMQKLVNESKKVYLQIDPDNEEIIELLYNNFHKFIGIIDYQEQINYYSYELFKFFVDNSPKNPLIWSLEKNEWEVQVRKDIFKNDLITDLLSQTLAENQNKIGQIRDPDIQRLIIEFVALQALNGQPFLNKRLDDILLYQAFHNNPLIEKFKGNFLKQLIEIKFFDQNSPHQDYKEFIKNQIQVQTRSSNFIDRLEIECIIACLNNPNLQKNQLFEQRKEEMYKQNIRNYINSFIYRIQENQIQTFEIQYQKSYNHWIQIFEENVTKFKSSDEALAYIQKEICSLFNQKIEYLEANYIIGFNYNELFIANLDDFQRTIQTLQLDFESNPKKFSQQQYVQQAFYVKQEQQINQLAQNQQLNHKGFTENPIPQNTPPILVTPLSSIETYTSQTSSRQNPDLIYSANHLSNNQQHLGNPLQESVQDQNQFFIASQNNLGPPQGQFNLSPSIEPPQGQQTVGNPLDQTIKYEEGSNIRITESVSPQDENVYTSDVIQRPQQNNLEQIISQTITSDNELKQKLIEFATKYQINQFHAQTFLPNIQSIMRFPLIYITQIFKETQNYHKIQQNQINYDYHSQLWNKEIQKEEFLKALLQSKEQAFQYATQMFALKIKLVIDATFQQLAKQSIQQ